jgi:hypothetical protein
MEVEHEVVAEVSVIDFGEPAIVEHVLIAELPERVLSGDPAELAVLARHVTLTVGGLDWPRVRGIARVAHLFAPRVLEGETVVGHRDGRDLPVVVC